MASDLMLKTAEELSELIRTRTVSSRELLDEAIARFEAFNPIVNAITEHKIEEAQKASSNADEATARGDSIGVLHGLPVTIKGLRLGRYSFNLGNLNGQQLSERNSTSVTRLQTRGDHLGQGQRPVHARRLAIL